MASENWPIKMEIITKEVLKVDKNKVMGNYKWRNVFTKETLDMENLMGKARSLLRMETSIRENFKMEELSEQVPWLKTFIKNKSKLMDCQKLKQVKSIHKEWFRVKLIFYKSRDKNHHIEKIKAREEEKKYIQNE